jgi:mediator of RNA polymerase II transcription subunit 18
MHELLLLGQVPARRHDQLLQILAGIAGMTPAAVAEDHLVFRPKHIPAQKEAPIGASQVVQDQRVQALQGQMKGDLFHLQVVVDALPWLMRRWRHAAGTPQTVEGHGDESDASRFGSTHVADSAYARVEGSQPSRSWLLRFSDLPEVAGRRPVTSRMVSEVNILNGSPKKFMDALGYECVGNLMDFFFSHGLGLISGYAIRYVSEYLHIGHRVVHNNIVIQLFRLYTIPRPGPGQRPKPFSALKGFSESSLLTLVDPSEAFILQATVRVQDGSNPESMSLAVGELQAFKDVMKGVVELEPGDRLAMDTRVR